ncbi:DNA replication protein DnaD [Geobacillus subterraneus]|uniref:DNA replication protein DnaD n=2 Tax=Geobacillus TaxID=129337 RepID=A0ABN4ND75_9BACL|nr:MULTISPECIES: DnaD domain protein [Geobacillus]AMX82488.1 DNA replication protein DnaD [Geobacillus subterraneus]KZS24492.1 DNA replication protein DnaD [Geobacillus subterraneus]OXB91520.1 DNA replication protein DnaD [Geobacillus uzenensis]
MTKLLLDDEPLIILPQLAVAIGLNESIIVQQLHYWLEKSENIRDGYKWVYNTYADWQEQFPFWSESTIRRIITKLEKLGIIVSANFNRSKVDKTKWYRIDYNQLAEWTQKTPFRQKEQPPGANGGPAGDSGSTVLDRLATASYSSVQRERPAAEVADLPILPGRSVDEWARPSVQAERSMDEINGPSGQNRRLTDEIARSSVQIEPSSSSNGSIGVLNVNRPIPENTTEITSERKREEKEDGERVRAYKEIVRFCEQNGFGAIGGYLREKINVWVDDTSEELVLEALKIAVENGAKRWVYVETILRDWAEKGYRTIDEVRAARLAFRKQRVNQRSPSPLTESSRTMRKPIRTEIVPDWLNMDYSQPEDDDFDIEQARRELEERLKKYKAPS